MCCNGKGGSCHRRAEGLLGDVLASGGRGATQAGDPVADLGFAAVALGVAGEEACQAALASRGASALLCRLLQARCASEEAWLSSGCLLTLAGSARHFNPG